MDFFTHLWDRAYHKGRSAYNPPKRTTQPKTTKPIPNMPPKK